MADDSLKVKTARTLKWNLIDRVASQVLYAVTGIVLARELSQEDFGLVGAILVFQAFASLMVDSGFSYALIQRKEPTRLDYSSVLWFNIGASVCLYGLLYACAPLIAGLFGADGRLVPLSRVMFLTFVLNATAIVQTNRFMKQMNVRPVAVANTLALTAGGAVGIVLALTGYGAWAIVWQSIVLSGVKSALLWAMSRWRPVLRFSWTAMRSFFRVGGGMMFTSFLNTLFLNIYSFLVGNRVGLVSLGYYTQGDKWSKMFVSSLSQVLTSSFLPVLSGVQDDAPRFDRLTVKMNRMTSYIVFPVFIGLIVMAEPIFHALFGSKWDPAIILFQLLLVRGIFTVFTSLYTNYLLALGHAGAIARLEVWRDVVAIVGLVATFPFMRMSTPDMPTLGVAVMLIGQIIAAVVAWVLTLLSVRRYSAGRWRALVTGYVPYMAITAVAAVAMYLLGALLMPALLPAVGDVWSTWIVLAAEGLVGLAVYMGINAGLHSRIQHDAIAYLRGRL